MLHAKNSVLAQSYQELTSGGVVFTSPPTRLTSKKKPIQNRVVINLLLNDSDIFSKIPSDVKAIVKFVFFLDCINQ